VNITITLDDNTVALARKHAQARGLTLSQAISELIRRATQRRPRIKYVGGLPVFDLPKSRRRITRERVALFEADDIIMHPENLHA
jgi:hypothetical protein